MAVSELADHCDRLHSGDRARHVDQSFGIERDGRRPGIGIRACRSRGDEAVVSTDIVTPEGNAAGSPSENAGFARDGSRDLQRLARGNEDVAGIRAVPAAKRVRRNLPRKERDVVGSADGDARFGPRIG